MDPIEFTRDKHDVLLPLRLPQYSAERRLEQVGDWVLIAVLQLRQDQREAVPVLDYDHRTFLQRYQDPKEITKLAQRISAIRVAGGWALNLRTGETVAIAPLNGKRS